MTSALPCEKLNEKSKAKQISVERQLTIIRNSRTVQVYEKNLNAVFNCSKFKLIKKCNNFGHLSSPLSNSFFSCPLETVFLWTTPPSLPVFLRFFRKASKNSFASVKAGSARDYGKRFVVRQRAKETINDGSSGFHR